MDPVDQHIGDGVSKAVNHVPISDDQHVGDGARFVGVPDDQHAGNGAAVFTQQAAGQSIHTTVNGNDYALFKDKAHLFVSSQNSTADWAFTAQGGKLEQVSDTNTQVVRTLHPFSALSMVVVMLTCDEYSL